MTAVDPRRHRRCCMICCSVSLSLILTLIIVVIILAFTVFKTKKPVIQVENVSLLSFNAKFTLVQPSSVNITLAIAVSVYNPNKASFRYTDSTARIYYHGAEVATVPIPPGQIGSESTEKISTTADVYADKLVSNINSLLSDLTDDSLPFDTKTEISGKVKVLGFIKHHVDILSQCTFTIKISKAAIEDQVCQNKVSL